MGRSLPARLGGELGTDHDFKEYHSGKSAPQCVGSTDNRQLAGCPRLRLNPELCQVDCELGKRLYRDFVMVGKCLDEEPGAVAALERVEAVGSRIDKPGYLTS